MSEDMIEIREALATADECESASGFSQSLMSRAAKTIRSLAALNEPQQVVVTDIMCKAAINADLEDRIQGCSYKGRHVIYDTWLPPPSQDIWTLPVGSAEDYQAFQEQCKIERMRKVLEAALALSRPQSK